MLSARLRALSHPAAVSALAALGIALACARADDMASLKASAVATKLSELAPAVLTRLPAPTTGAVSKIKSLGAVADPPRGRPRPPTTGMSVLSLGSGEASRAKGGD